MILTSKNNPLIKETASLKEKKGRKALGSFLVEGWKMANECQKSGMNVEYAFVTESFKGELFIPNEKIVKVTDDVLKHLSDEKTPQGVVCRVQTPIRALKKPTDKCLLLDGVADPGNMGAIIRTANAAGYRQIYLTNDCTDPYSPKSVRASMSGVFFTEIYTGAREELIELFSGVPLFVADMDGENLFKTSAPNCFALIIGNEANGVSALMKDAATKRVRIPMQETQESLNAAVSAGIAMYLLARKEFEN